MESSKSLTVFENKQVRRHYDDATETWYFSVVDIAAALTDSANPTDYLKKLRKRANWDPTYGQIVPRKKCSPTGKPINSVGVPDQ